MDIRWMGLVALLVSGCGGEVVTREINVGPTAHAKLPEIERAVRMLNLVAGEDVFVLRVVDSHESIPGEATVHVVEFPGSRKRGYTGRRGDSISILLRADASVRTIAHELCHAAGLHHVDERHNLMYPDTRSRDHWALSYEQRDELLSLLD